MLEKVFNALLILPFNDDLCIAMLLGNSVLLIKAYRFVHKLFYKT